jgi:serine/threonine protein kinase
MRRSNAPYLTTEVVILNLLGGQRGFPKINEIRCDPPNYSLVMPNLGEPLEPVGYKVDWLVQILRLLVILHKHDIVHCDLKPDNILIDKQGHISIIDFSHSYIMSNYNDPLIDKNGNQRFNQSGHHQLGGPDVSGTYRYIAPEAYSYSSDKTTAVDIWSLGCLLYELITFTYLFDNHGCHDPKTYRESIQLMRHNHASLDGISGKITNIAGHETEKNLLYSILVRDPKQRPTAVELLYMLGQGQGQGPHLYIVNCMPRHFPSSSRLRCYDLPPYLQTHVDSLFNYFLNQKTTIDRFDLLYAIHLVVVWTFISKSGEYDPYDTLLTGKEYMAILTTLVKMTNFRVMYDDIQRIL